MDPGQRLTEEPELIRRWMVYPIICGFLAGLGLCLITDLTDSNHRSQAASTVTHTAHDGGASALLGENQFGSTRLLLASSVVPEQNTFYEGVSLPPPAPPPRG